MAKREYKQVDLTPYQPCKSLSILGVLLGLVLLSLSLVFLYEYII